MTVDLPPPPAAAAVTVAAAPSQPASSAPGAPLVVLKVCDRMERGKGYLLPMKALSDYLHRSTGREGPRLIGAELQVLRPPRHGELLPDPEPDPSGTSFIFRAAESDWLGVDKFSVEIRYADRRYRIDGRIEMVPYVDQDEKTGAPYRGACDARLRRVGSEGNVNPVTVGFGSSNGAVVAAPVFPRLRGGAGAPSSLGSAVRIWVASQGAQRWW